MAGTLLFSLALIVFVGAIARTTVTTASAVEAGPVLAAPGELTTDLDAGRHALWVSDREIIGAEQVTVIGPDGPVEVTTNRSSLPQGTTLGDESVTPQVTFDAPTPGSYRITTVESFPATPVVVAALDTLAPAFVLVVLAIGVLGGVLALIGLVQRWRSGRPPPSSSPTSDAGLG